MKALVGIEKGKQFDMLLALAAIFVLPVYYYGIRILIMLATALITALLTDFAVQKIFKYQRCKRVRFHPDLSSIISAAVCILLLSAAAPYWVAAVAVAFGLMIAKYPFGGKGHNIFNPAAVGLSFVGLCWPEYVFRYPEPFTQLQLTGTATEKLVNSLGHQVSLGGTPNMQAIDILLGRFAGPIGATAILILFACGIYLLLRKRISVFIPVSVLFIVGSISLVSARISGDTTTVLAYELASGILLFGSVFLAGDPATIPSTKLGKTIFGILLGFLTVGFKLYGQNDYGFLYALLIMNAMSNFCDTLGQKIIIAINRQFPLGQNVTIKQDETQGEAL